MKKLLIVALMLTGGMMYASAQTTGKSCCSKDAAANQKSCCSKGSASTSAEKSCHGSHASAESNTQAEDGQKATPNSNKNRNGSTEKSLNKTSVSREKNTGTPAKTK